MKNGYSVEMKGDKMIITVDLKSDLGPSKSGKTRLIASSGPGEKHGDITLGINVYRKG